MPTPSSPPSEPQSHSFASTCPDDQQIPHSPSSWHPHPPPPYPANMEDDHSHDSLTADDDRSSRSTTMSPRPTPSSDGSAPEPESMLPRHDADDSHKQQDTDEVMTGADHDRASGRSILSLAGVPEGHVYIPSVRRHRGGNSASDIPSPISADGGDKFDDPNSLDGYGWLDDYGFSMGYDYSNLRVIPTTPSSFLRPGSRFVGTQQSERQVYDVQVEIKHVDLRESFLCGYLRIQGLTEDHPSLTTYFEGEIIGTKYGFMTKHESWGANDRIDLSHWAKFNAFRQFAKQAKKGNVAIKDFAQKENIFMRWKEHFLVPDHRVRTINGASFEGFYYICFNQVEGKVSGIYFHSKSEKFQQLDLKHVEDRGCFGAMEFR